MRTTVTVQADVEVDAEELRSQGWRHDEDEGDWAWHYEDNCPAEGFEQNAEEAEAELEGREERLLLFCDALHRAAHGEYPWRSADCAQQPCRSLHDGAERPWPT